MICWHSYTRWRKFTYVEYGRIPGDPPGYDYVVRREFMQERNCRRCGKVQEKAV